MIRSYISLLFQKLSLESVVETIHTLTLKIVFHFDVDLDPPDEYLWSRNPDSVAYMSANLNFILAKIARIITCIVQILSTLWRYLSQAFATFNQNYAPFELLNKFYCPFSFLSWSLLLLQKFGGIMIKHILDSDLVWLIQLLLTKG